MKHNVGGMDLYGRIILGVILLVAGLAAPIDMIWRIVALAFAVIALGTAAARFCPVNKMLGINTCKMEGDEHTHHGTHGPTGTVTH